MGEWGAAPSCDSTWRCFLPVPFKAAPRAPLRSEPRPLSITPATQSIQSIAHTPAAIYFWRAVCEKQRHGGTTPNLYEGKMSRGAETWSGTERPGGGHVAGVWKRSQPRDSSGRFSDYKRNRHYTHSTALEGRCVQEPLVLSSSRTRQTKLKKKKK